MLGVSEWFMKYELHRDKNVCVCCNQPFNIQIHNIDPERIPEDFWKPGLIYSKEGLRKKDFLGMCEYCFNLSFPG